MGGGPESFSGSTRGDSLRSQFNMFLPGGFSGGGLGELRVDDGDIGSSGERTILASEGSFQVLQGFETRVETPLSVEGVERLAYARGETRGTSGEFDTPKETEEEEGFFFREPASTYHSAASAGGARNGNKRDERPASKVSVPTHGLYGPHGSGTGICGGIVARGAQGQFPDRFCLKTRCRFSSHSSKNYRPKLEQGAYYVKESDSHGYCKLFLSSEAAKLAPEGLLEGHNSVPCWKAII